MNRHVLALLALGAVTACDTPTAPRARAITPAPPSLQSAPTNQEQWASDEFILVNPCNGDMIDVTGMVHRSIMIDASGATRMHVNGADLTGASATGTPYNFVRVSKEEGTLDPLDVIFTAQYRVISLGSEPNFLLDMTAHLYTDATGFHADVLHTSAKCVG